MFGIFNLLNLSILRIEIKVIYWKKWLIKHYTSANPVLPLHLI